MFQGASPASGFPEKGVTAQEPSLILPNQMNLFNIFVSMFEQPLRNISVLLRNVKYFNILWGRNAHFQDSNLSWCVSGISEFTASWALPKITHCKVFSSTCEKQSSSLKLCHFLQWILSLWNGELCIKMAAIFKQLMQKFLKIPQTKAESHHFNLI